MRCVNCYGRKTTLIGYALLLCGLIIVLCCVPFWLWLTILGCLLAALGICVLIG